jgi:hypothetical protein
MILNIMIINIVFKIFIFVYENNNNYIKGCLNNVIFV